MENSYQGAKSIFIPRGTINENVDTIIEIPNDLKDNNMLIARRVINPKPNAYLESPVQHPGKTPIASMSRIPVEETPHMRQKHSRSVYTNLPQMYARSVKEYQEQQNYNPSDYENPEEGYNSSDYQVNSSVPVNQKYDNGPRYKSVPRSYEQEVSLPNTQTRAREHSPAKQHHRSATRREYEYQQYPQEQEYYGEDGY